MAVFVVACLLGPSRAAGQQQVTPPAPILVSSPIITINNSPGNQTDPHVSKDLAAYTDLADGHIHYYRFSTGVDAVIPSQPGNQDTLSGVGGNRICFSRQTGPDSEVGFFDTITLSVTMVDPHPGDLRIGCAIRWDTLVYVDYAPQPIGTGDIFAYDLAANPPVPPQAVSLDPGQEQNPNVSPDGNTVVWENCPTVTNCDIWKAVRSGGVWTASVAVSSPAFEEFPDTDGTWITYDSANQGAFPHVYFVPVGGGPTTLLNVPGVQINPSISKGFIGFESTTPNTVHPDIYVYDIALNILYQVTSTPGFDEQLNDISVLDNGDVRVVWAANDGDPVTGAENVYGTTFTPIKGGDFAFSGIAPLTITAGGSGSTSVSVNPTGAFNSAVNLSVSGQSAGVTATLSPNSVTPSGGNSASSILNVSAASFVVPTNFTLTVTGTSGALSHSATANVSVSATATSTSNSIGDMVNAGCIDNAGIANALTTKLAAAQSAGSVQTAINTLTALKNQIQAQAGKHIHTACTIGGVAFNPVTVLLLDVQALIDSLRVSLIPDPITGYAVDGSGMGLAGATVSILNSGNAVVASATTDITGFYFLATTGVLTPGASYTIAVTGLPAGFGNVTPANQPFTWQGTAVAIGNFVVN